MSEALRRVATEVERRKIEHALKDAGGNRMAAAEALYNTEKPASFSARLKRVVRLSFWPATCFGV